MLGSVRRLGVVHTYKVADEAAPAPGGLEYSQSSFVHAPAAFTNEVGPMRLVGDPPDGSVELCQGADKTCLLALLPGGVVRSVGPAVESSHLVGVPVRNIAKTEALVATAGALAAKSIWAACCAEMIDFELPPAGATGYGSDEAFRAEQLR